MGMMDMAKLARKAQQTRSSMKKLNVAGRSKSGKLAILIDGLNDILEIQFSDELLNKPSAKELEREIIQAYGDAKKALEKEIANTMDLDTLKDMISL